MTDVEDIRVLLVEDNPTDALIVQDELAHTSAVRFSVVHIEQLKEALAHLGTQCFDVVLLDLSLPDSSGIETFARLHAAAAETPIVVLSGRADEELAVKAVHAGAQDYLVKGHMAEDVLPRSIRYAIERQRGERILAESEERYRKLIEGSPNAYLVHCDGKIVFANAASLKLFGADHLDQLLGRPIIETVSSEFRDVVRKRFQNAEANGTNSPIELMGVRLDGTTVAVEGSSAPFNHEGRPAVQVVLHDITERKRAEERVREQAAMLDHAHDAIIVRDIHTRRITFWNQGAERMYGWTRAEAEGRDIGDLIFANPALPDIGTEELLSAGEWQGEYQHLTKAGKKMTVSGHVTLVRDSHGAPKSALIININITHQKDLEARFLRAQRMESIGTLASGVAHDLNNILAPIMMSAPLLRGKLTQQQQEEIVSTIEISAARGAQIIKQVLTFGRGLEGERHPLEVNALIDEIMKIMRETFPKNIAIEIQSEPRLWPVLGDATQLHQILLNLCVNARDAMPDGGTLRMHAANLGLDSSYASTLLRATPGPHVLLEVSDTGCGIPPAIIERIFDPFFTTKEVGKGTGLGLSTVLGIAKSHGGFINVNSQPGKGTDFQIYLPAAADRETAPSDAAIEDSPRGDGELILVVDDEPAVAEMARTVLESHGYTVLLAGDGIEALALFARNIDNVDAVLTDLMMPLLDGVALIHALLKMKPALPVIASTGLGEKRKLTELERLGVETILDKPYSAATLLRTVNGAVNPKTASNGDRTPQVSGEESDTKRDQFERTSRHSGSTLL